MKTLTKFLAATLMIVLVSVITLQASASGKNDQLQSITNISATGHVYVYVKKGEKEKIEVVPGYDKDNTLIELADGTLTIASFNDEELTIVVTITDLESIEANGNAFVHALTDLGISSQDVFVADDAAVLLKTGTSEVFLSDEK